MKLFVNGRLSGLAVVELVMVSTLVLLALGLAVPLVKGRIEENERSQAIGDLRNLAADLLNYEKDTGAWPRNKPLAFTDGEPASNEDAAFGYPDSAEHISLFLVANKPAVSGWHGPYMSVCRPDAWGHRYVVVLEGLKSPQAPYGWVISAGPDGVFQTSKNDRDLRGDDIGLLLR